MLERCRLSHRACFHAVANRDTLHEDDRVVTVLSCRSCRETDDIAGLNFSHYLFKCKSREVMAFVHNDVSVFCNGVLYGLLRRCHITGARTNVRG